MDQEYFTIKQMADQLGLPKQRVYRCIRANHISEAHRDTVNGNTVLMYSKSDFYRIKAILQKSTASSEVHHEVHLEAHHDTLYAALLKQLEILNNQLITKDQQIQDLTMRLAEAHHSLDQAQQLHAVDRQRLLELDAKDDIVSDSERGPEPSKSFWRRLFKHK